MTELVLNMCCDLNAIGDIISKAGEHFGRVIKKMCDGVAFPDEKDGKLYHVFSHEGDELGTLTAADVSYAIHFVKQQGRMVGKMRSSFSHMVDGKLKFYEEPTRTAYTFAWVDWYRYNGRIL